MGSAPWGQRWLERSPEPVLICRFDRRILWANAAFVGIAGRPAARLEGQDCASFVLEEQRGALEEAFRRLAAGASVSGRLGLVNGDGEVIWIQGTIIPDPERQTSVALGRRVGAERHRLRRARYLQRDLAHALESVTDGFALFDRDDRLVHSNRKFRELYPMLRAARDEVPTFQELTRDVVAAGLVPAAHGREEAWIEERVRHHRKPRGFRHFKLADGRWMQVDEQRTGRGGTVLVRSDVTALKRREQAYSLFAAAVDQSAEAIEICGADGRLLYVNPAFTRLTGYEPSEALGRVPAGFLRSGHHDDRLYQRVEAQLGRGEVWSGRLVNRRKDGSLIHQDATISPLRDETGAITHFVAVKRDVTGQIEAEARIRHLAHHDALTDLPNRTLFRDRLRQALAETQRNGEQRALLLLDLDHFKDINDTLGHAIGDTFLCQVAGRLQACVRGADTVSRLGGDEFAVLQARAEGSKGAAALASRIIESLSRPFVVEGHEVRSSASLGITLIPDDGQDQDQLLKQADLALYRAKSEGRGTFQFFLSDFRDAQEHRASLEHDLGEALSTGQLALDFQPLVDLESMTIHGVEALLRWRHPTRGVIPPQTIIPIAEEGGLLVPLTSWVLENACREARHWAEQGLPPVRVAVNLSPAQFRHHALVEMVEQALSRSGLPGHLLELEVQEPALSHDPKRALAVIRRLNTLGVQFSMDDFGTGTASLSALRRFPLQKIKIDQTFVREIATDPAMAAMVKAIIGLGKSLRLRITAEGVESEEQLISLKGEGCEEAQGYYLSRPMPSTRIAAIIRERFPRQPDPALPREPLEPAE